jgi:hypothetical protein
MAQNSAKGSSYITPSLDGLTDVTIAGATTNQVLTYNGTAWVNSATQGDMLKSVYDTDNDGVVDSAEKEVLDVRNTSGSTIAKGSVVYIGGATGQLPTILLADADTEATSSKTIGLTLDAISNNSNGVIITSGLFHDLDTSAFSDGDSLWLSSTAGGMVANTPPAEPAHSVYIGRVAYAHPTQGKIVVAIQNGYELDELHGVRITSEANQDVLRYETSSGLWKNQQIETASGSQKGLLSSTDWTTFNNKANTASPTFTGTPLSTTAASGTNTTQIATTAFVQDAINKQPEVIQVACSDETTNLTTGTAKITFRMPYAMTLTSVRASLSTAQTAGSIFTVDINENGTSILSTKLTIDNNEKTSTTAATAAVISDSALADDGEITVDIDQVGTAGAKGLKVTLIGTRA